MQIDWTCRGWSLCSELHDKRLTVQNVLGCEPVAIIVLSCLPAFFYHFSAGKDATFDSNREASTMPRIVRWVTVVNNHISYNNINNNYSSIHLRYSNRNLSILTLEHTMKRSFIRPVLLKSQQDLPSRMRPLLCHITFAVLIVRDNIFKSTATLTLHERITASSVDLSSSSLLSDLVSQDEDFFVNNFFLCLNQDWRWRHVFSVT